MKIDLKSNNREQIRRSSLRFSPLPAKDFAETHPSFSHPPHKTQS